MRGECEAARIRKRAEMREAWKDRVALQAVALNTWRGQAGNVGAAQKAFHHRARMNSLAAKGQWKKDLEKQLAAA